MSLLFFPFSNYNYTNYTTFYVKIWYGSLKPNHLHHKNYNITNLHLQYLNTTTTHYKHTSTHITCSNSQYNTINSHTHTNHLEYNVTNENSSYCVCHILLNIYLSTQTVIILPTYNYDTFYRAFYSLIQYHYVYSTTNQCNTFNLQQIHTCVSKHNYLASNLMIRYKNNYNKVKKYSPLHFYIETSYSCFLILDRLLLGYVLRYLRLFFARYYDFCDEKGFTMDKYE